ncbi:MAG: hypothetical protein E5X57_32295, partial [Mesorhizobium sp.]
APAFLAGRYTHRVAISKNRLIDIENGSVHFRYWQSPPGAKARPLPRPARHAGAGGCLSRKETDHDRTEALTQALSQEMSSRSPGTDNPHRNIRRRHDRHAILGYIMSEGAPAYAKRYDA